MYFFVIGLLMAAFAMPAAAQSTFPPPIWASQLPGSFVTLEDSDLSTLVGSIPTAYPGSPVDTSGWTQYNVTTAGGTGVLSGCADLDNTGNADNSAAFECMITRVPDRSLLYFPDGIYDFRSARDGISVFRPTSAHDYRGLVFESRNAVINVVADFNNVVVFMEGEQTSGGVGEIYSGPARSWSGNRTKGTRVLSVSDTSGFTTTPNALGNWVHIYADPNSIQDAAQRSYYSRVTAINPGQSITIEHPLPEDFTGNNAGVRIWDPAINWVFRGGTIQFENPHHLSNYFSWNLYLKNMALSEISNMHFKDAYRQYLGLEWTADIYMNNVVMTGHAWDKATNGYAVTWANSVRNHLHDSLIEALTGIAFSNGSQESLVTLTHFAGPTGAQPFAPHTFDVGCNNSPYACDISAINQAHAQVHGPTLDCADGNGDGFCDARPTERGIYLHCTQNSEGDLLGLRGDPSCRGTPSTAVYTCVEFHDRAASNTLFMRNHCEGPIWFDHSFGPGRGNFFFGTWMEDAGLPEFDTTPGTAGDFFFRDIGSVPPGYRQSATWANMVFDNNLGSGMGFDAYGDGVRALDNVIRGNCFSLGQASDTNSQCVTHSTSDSQERARNTVWTNNTVGADVHASPRTMPSLPGFTEWPEVAGNPSTPPPYIGPEMGDPDDFTGCLPVTERWYGSCSQR